MSFVIIKQVLYKYSESVSINGERHEAFRNFAKKSEPSGPAVHDLSMNSLVRKTEGGNRRNEEVR